MFYKNLILALTCTFVAFGSYSQNLEFEQLMAQDWPDLQKYREENRRIIERGKEVSVVFMGNSITENWVKLRPDFFRENNFVGRGISGQTSPQMLIRFTPDVLDLQPRAVLILAGTNDIAGNTGFASIKMITDNIKAMAELATFNDIEVILASILPVYQYDWRQEVEPREKIRGVNLWLQEYAKENGLTYLDFYSAMGDERDGLPKKYSEDGVHPNEEGYKVMEQLARKAIKKAVVD